MLDQGREVPVVVVLFNDLLVLLARGGGGMEVRNLPPDVFYLCLRARE